ncbi:MAG TPA: VCBS repeat-containing protein, partial [Haliscomenobacter sp.]|nr:VCBS repeat-containing protein [Haliscomenobacter sp.]
MKKVFAVVLSLITLAFAKAQSLFEPVNSSRSGVSFKNIIVENATQNALTYENLFNGGGIAVGDINNDGLEDIYFISNMQLNKLYLNQGNFKFKDITQAAGVAGRVGWKSGTSMVDINGDGLLDIYVCYSGKTDAEKRRNQFFINQGNLSFIDKAQEMGLDDPSYTTQVSFFDYDRDGDLDAFLLATNVKVIRDLEYSQARKSKHPYAGDKLFRNDNG